MYTIRNCFNPQGSAFHAKTTTCLIAFFYLKLIRFRLSLYRSWDD